MTTLEKPLSSSIPKSIFKELLLFDRDFLSHVGPGPLIGADEVGRGSLIGPVVASAVCFPASLTRSEQRLLETLNDSKKLTPRVRAELCDAIHSCCRVGIGEASKEEVDTINIHHASLLAIQRAYDALCTQLSPTELETAFLLLDGRCLLPGVAKARQQSVIKGDGQSAAIAAASVVAKHTRDSYILKLAQSYPGYGWETNMGYSTPEHRAGIAKQGRTLHHRNTFACY